MRFRKSILALMIAAVTALTPLTAALTVPEFATEAQAKVESTTRLTMTVGESCRLQLRYVTGNATWISKKPKVVSITRDGMATALKPGKAKIIAKVKGKKYACIITVNKKITGNSGISNITPAITEAEAHSRMEQARNMSRYADGATWGNEKVYYWYNRLGYNTYKGIACQAFAFEISDRIFGDLEPRQITTNLQNYRVRVGDILRIRNSKGSEHSVVVFEVYDDGYVVAEGNLGGKVSWTRKLDKNSLYIYYIITRYPQ